MKPASDSRIWEAMKPLTDVPRLAARIAFRMVPIEPRVA